MVGIHNGNIVNDDELMTQHGFERAEPEMTVDSEVIFALAEATGGPHARSRSSAARWPRPGSTSASPGCSSSPAASAGRSGSARAATRSSSPRRSSALEIAERYTGVRLRKREVGEGTLVAIEGDARSVRASASCPTRPSSTTPLPAVRAPHEGAFCLSGSPRSRPL